MLTKDEIEILSQEFNDDKIGVKVNSLSKNKDKALLVLYLQHTDVADRLDMIDPSWEFKINETINRDVMDNQGKIVRTVIVCRGVLTLKGAHRENYGEGDDHKSAASDCFKRCAMLFGVGRYLYDQDKQWVPYNPEKDKFRVWTIKDYLAGWNGQAPKQQSKPKQDTPAPKNPPQQNNQTPSDVCPSCRNRMMVSNYDETQFYCGKCKKRYPRPEAGK